MTEEEPSRKRAREIEEVEELEIDVNLEEPLSKRAARRLKKGRTLKQAPSSQKPLPKEFQDDESGDDIADDNVDQGQEDGSESKVTKKDKKSSKTKHDKTSTKESNTSNSDSTTATGEYKKGTNGIWIGNLSFRTTEADLTTFFSTLRPLGKQKPASSYPIIEASDVVRISLPAGIKKGECKGFAYIDFMKPEQVETAVGLSERILAGRNVLIKPASNFDGRPSTAAGDGKTGTPSSGTKILFVGNLSFDVTSEDLSTYLGGEAAGIKKIRMATFEDSGKCKGFAFCDFNEVDQVKRILGNKKLLSMNGRKLKMEFGEDRSLRRKPPTNRPDEFSGNNGRGGSSGGRMVGDKVDARSIKPGKALMDAPRASHAIVASKGEKVNFD